MERLTFKDNGCVHFERKTVKVTNTQLLDKLGEYEDIGTVNEFKKALDNVKILSAMYEKLNDQEVLEYHKLAEYEDLEKQGKLLKLPCKVGDTVYTACSWGIESGVVGSIEIMQDRIFINNIHGQMIGEAKNIFLTKEEAETALKEMEGKHETD